MTCVKISEKTRKKRKLSQYVNKYLQKSIPTIMTEDEILNVFLLKQKGTRVFSVITAIQHCTEDPS